MDLIISVLLLFGWVLSLVVYLSLGLTFVGWPFENKI